jgi:RNA methyltransferase, TrmH family
VRASMGAVFSVPVTREGDLGALPGTKIALAARQGPPLHELRRFPSEGLTENAKVRPGEDDGVTILVGSEREGLPPDLVAAADHVAHIPIHTDSLNAAMAATVALYELQTRMAHPR